MVLPAREDRVVSGFVPRSYWFLTREEFIIELDKELAERRRVRLAKFDRGAEKYGSTVDLFERDFRAEMEDELTDHDNYRLFDRVKRRKREALK